MAKIERGDFMICEEFDKKKKTPYFELREKMPLGNSTVILKSFRKEDIVKRAEELGTVLKNKIFVQSAHGNWYEMKKKQEQKKVLVLQ